MALKRPMISFVLMIFFGLLIQFGFNEYIQLNVLFILGNIILAMSLNLVNGYTGQFSLGHAGFMAVGAYFSAWASSQLELWPAISFFVYSIGGGLLAGFAGFLVGQPSLRLKGDYLAIVTLGFGEIIRVILLNMDFLGGARGFSGISPFPEVQLGSFTITKFLVGYIYSSIWVLICFFVIWRLIRSSHGRTFLSVREDEVAAQAMGINVTQAKVRAFVISSFFAGVSGSLFAHVQGYISPGSFSFILSVNAVVMVVLGGMGSLTGSVIAAIFITILPEALRSIREVTGGPDLRMVIYSLVLILIMIWMPKGLLGEREIHQLWRRKS